MPLVLEVVLARAAAVDPVVLGLVVLWRLNSPGLLQMLFVQVG